ncbi:MAG: hypothetical protein CMO20_03385 [Thermoplasmata archaeon]|nr:hypothetical protein [Thermoplasmata archaeon]
MGWWPFSKKGVDLTNEPQVKGTRSWLQELRNLCEINYDKPDEGKKNIIQFQNEWREAHKRKEVTEELVSGLEKRAIELLSAGNEEWINWLDDENFWKPGWKNNSENEDDEPLGS